MRHKYVSKIEILNKFGGINGNTKREERLKNSDRQYFAQVQALGLTL